MCTHKTLTVYTARGVSVVRSLPPGIVVRTCAFTSTTLSIDILTRHHIYLLLLDSFHSIDIRLGCSVIL